VTEETRTLLEQLAIDGKLNEHIQAMFNGQVREKKKKKKGKKEIHFRNCVINQYFFSENQFC
jgi:hypothetical protein